MKAELAEYIAGMGMKQGTMTADILVKALFAGGENAAALKLLTEPNDNGWAKEIAKGYTFTWEAWNANTSENSQSHGWGSAAAKDILANFAGVMVTAPGAEKVRIAPAYCSLTSLDSSVSTERGNVRVSYSRSETDFDVTVTVPSNVTAEIVLPRLGEGEFARVNGAKPDSSLTETEQVFTVGGGTYEFTYSGEISVLPEEPVYNEPLPEGMTGTDDAGTYTWTIGAADPAETAGTVYEDKNDIADLSVSLGRGDYLDEGIVFTASSVKEPNTSGQASLADTKRYIAVQPKKDGTFSLTAAFDRAGSSSKDRIYYADLGEGAELASAELSQYYKGSHMTAGADITSTGETVRTIDMTAGHTYIIYTYRYGSRITALSYTYTDTPAPATDTPATAAPATEAPATTAPATAAPENTPEAAERLQILRKLLQIMRRCDRIYTVKGSGGDACG